MAAFPEPGCEANYPNYTKEISKPKSQASGSGRWQDAQDGCEYANPCGAKNEDLERNAKLIERADRPYGDDEHQRAQPGEDDAF